MPEQDLTTKLRLAVFHARVSEVRKFIQEGADVNGVADRRVSSVALQTPVWCAVKSAKREGSEPWTTMCALLGEVVPEVKPRDTQTKRQQYLEILEILIQSGADLEKRCYGGTPLRLAVIGDDLELLQILLGRGASPNAESESVFSKLAKKQGKKVIPAYHGTVLHEAAFYGLPRMIEVLLKAGADPRRGDHEGKTALEVAKEKGFPAVVKVLEPHTPTIAREAP